ADWGKDFYASQSFSDLPGADGRRVWMGWMSNWLYVNDEPTSPWRGVQSVPRSLALRRLPDGLRLVQSPVAELEALRASATPTLMSREAPLPGSADVEVELVRGTWSEAGLRLSNDIGEEVVIGVTAGPPQVFVDRRRSRATPFHDEYPGRHAGPLRWRDGRVRLRVLFDRTTLEVFANDGEAVVSERVYPTKALSRIELLGSGPAIPAPGRLHEMRSVWR
ncbi:MAG: GH32 C-terminal domain-containing protein, partial [Vicinamibacteria bacterium]